MKAFLTRIITLLELRFIGKKKKNAKENEQAIKIVELNISDRAVDKEHELREGE